MMKASLLCAVGTAIISIAMGSSAEAGSWTTRWTGPGGGVYEGNGNCQNGGCQASGTFTGPAGGLWRHSGNAHRIAPGEWAGEHTITSPGGRTWQNSWTWRAGSS